MPIGKSKISDMDFDTFENSLDKNIETDKASDKFDQQLQAYKDAGNTLTSAKEGVETATASMQEAKNKLDESTKKADAVTKAIDSFIAKVRDIKFKAKVDDADIEKLTDNRKKLIGDESKLLEDHRKANKEILTRHFYDMSNMMSRNGKRIRDASRYTSKKISLKLLFLSDIFLFPFVRQQFPVLA